MKKVLLLMILIMGVSCAKNVSKRQIDDAVELCARLGGLHEIDTKGGFISAVCKTRSDRTHHRIR